MEGITPSMQNTSLVPEKDTVFSETLSHFSPVVEQASCSEAPEGLPLRQEEFPEGLDLLLATDEIKSESEQEEYFADFYPEVSLNEEELGMQAQTQQIPVKVEDDDEELGLIDLEPTTPYLPSDIVNSLIRQFTGQMTTAQVRRSVSCFIPVIRVQNIESVQVITNIKETNPPRIQYAKTQRHGRIKRNIKSRRQLINGMKMKTANKRIPPIVIRNIVRRRGRPRKVLPEVTENPDFVEVEGSIVNTETSYRSCAECSKEFQTEQALLNHQKPIEDGETICETCNLDMKHPNCLRYHCCRFHGKEVALKDGKEESEASSRSCEICNKEFSRAASLVYHRRRIHNLGKSVQRKFSCKKCNKSFPQRSQLVFHKRAHQPEPTGGESDPDPREKKASCPTCEICGKVFTRSTGLLYHRRQVHRLGEVMERKFECTLCDKTFLKKSHLVLHGQSHTGLRLFPCRFCDRSFGGASGRRLHEEKVHGENASSLSPEAIERIRSETSLKYNSEPTQKTKGESSYTCSYCTKVFQRPSAKRIHERSHTGEKPFLCVVCGNAYKSSVALKEHEKTAHTKTLDLLCTICGAAFGRQMSLKYHILSRHTEKQFSCEQEGCGRSFVQRAKLIRHQRIHSKGFCQCPLCNRTLESEEQLDRHLKIHELRKLKLSGVVGIVVPRNTVTPRKKAPPKPRKERKTPAPLRKLQCSYCEKRFPYQNELDKHTKAIHTGEREFKCPEAGCPKAYISHYKLQNHLRSAHGHIIENNLLADVTCEECGKIVQGASRLAIHKKSRHSNGSKPLRPTTVVSCQRTRRLKGSVDVPAAHQNNTITSTTKDASSPTIRNTEIPTLPAPAPTTPLPFVTGYQPQRPPWPHVQPQAAHTPLRPIIASVSHQQQQHQVSVTHTLRANAYGGLQTQDQLQFFNFHPTYTPIQPANFPYASSPNVIHPSHHFQPTHFDFQTGNFWQAHQNPLTIRPQQVDIYQPQIPPPHAHHHHVDAVQEDYSTSDYSDLIHIPPQVVEYQQDTNYTDDIDRYSTSNPPSHAADEDCPAEPEEQALPARRRGRPPKSITGTPSAPKVKALRSRRSTTEPKSKKPQTKKHLPCQVCNKVFGTNQHLREHQKIHERGHREITEDYKCDVCGKKFSRAYYLIVHSVIHDPTVRPFKCNEPGCEEAFRAPAEFRKHACRHSSQPEKRYRCKICKEVKNNSGALDTHVREFHADRMHACKHPGCTFICPTRSRLKRHAEQHQDKCERVRPYKCTLCECSYIRGDNLQQHLDTAHNGAASAAANPDVANAAFPCHICSKQFEFDWKLKSHLRKTHGKKKRNSSYVPRTNKPLFFYCEDCDWSFADAPALRRHTKTKHKGEESISCLKQPCDRKFFYVNKLENHMKTQHEDLTREDELKLVELRETYPAEGVEEVKEKAPRRKSQRLRKTLTARQKAKSLAVEETDEEEEIFYAEDSVEEVKNVVGKGKKWQRSMGLAPWNSTNSYAKSSDDEVRMVQIQRKK